MKIATWNVNGIRARGPEVADWIARERPDVLCLQEIKAAADQVPALIVDAGEYVACWHGSKGYSGVAMLVRAAPDRPHPVFSHPPFDYETRIVTAQIGSVVAASVYVPNGGKDFDAKLRFLDALAVAAKGPRHGRIIAGNVGRAILFGRDRHHLELDRHRKIVEENREDRNTLAYCRLEVHPCETNRRVAPDIDTNLVGVEQLGAHGQP